MAVVLILQELLYNHIHAGKSYSFNKGAAVMNIPSSRASSGLCGIFFASSMHVESIVLMTKCGSEDKK